MNLPAQSQPQSAPSCQYECARRGDFLVSTDPMLFDLAVIHDYLANRSYWAQGRSVEIIERSIRNSLCFGLYESGKQAGFARVVTDQATFAWLCDVFILESWRGRGLSKWLLECILRHPGLQGLRRIVLATNDAHDLYHRYGFAPLSAPERFMEKVP